ncbi:MAG TPA: hypothetical protein VEB22_04450 [Phycisphaerales bacterium]|nr:hypothetical protein [Phycisphaerales bacterium]
MTRLRVWMIALAIAAAAMAVTIWLSGEPEPQQSQETPRQRGAGGGRSRAAWRSGRVAFVPELATPAEQVAHPRIVALAPGVAQIVRDLGFERMLVGRHANDDWSDPSLPSCGDQQGLDYERLIASNPTHVFIQWGENPLPKRLIELQKENGWIVRNIALLKLDDIRDAVVMIHDTTARQELAALRWERAHTYPNPEKAAPAATPTDLERAVETATFKLVQRFERALSFDPSLAHAGRTLLLYQGEGERSGASRSGSPAALGPGSYHHDLLLRIGGRSATDQGKPFMPLDAEDVASLAPDTIIIVRPRPATAGSAPTPTTDALLSSLGALARLDVPAVRNRRIAVIDDPMALIPGTNLAVVADRMREILGQWAAEPLSTK